MIEYLRSYITIHKNEKGASAVEYGLLVAAIAAVIVLIVFTLGDIIKDSFETTCDAIAGGGDATGTC